jgi:hypothetical protein
MPIVGSHVPRSEGDEALENLERLAKKIFSGSSNETAKKGND